MRQLEVYYLVQLPKAYDPKAYEADIYKLWESAGAFAPSGSGEPFCIIMPPPNANGELHIGHAVGYTLTDAVIRFKRMQGYKTLWLPGTDHAGIETQFVYERDVLTPQGKTRFDLGPDKFYQDVMAFTLQKQQNIIDQFRAMGFSADWTKLKFTLDEDIINIVYDTFKKLHDDGYIYRGNRIVNWCCRCNAAFADIELEHRNRQDLMYTLDYGPVQIATVRPETIFADVAVAVNPKDTRYKDLVGKEAVVPLVDRPIPIITDTHVDPKTGTGALKITPGHDADDYEIGLRHKLPEISVIDNEGKLINVPEQFAGLSVEQARPQVVAALRQAGKLVKEEPLEHAVAIHDRCGTIIEPLISEQWFLRIKDLNKPVIAALKREDVKIFPARFKKVALNWLEQEHDWCISRQIWWGIRIPIFYKTSKDPKKAPYIIAETEAKARAYFGAGNYRAETDTFDTWFSSGQWPFATLMTTGDFATFYPTSLMGTAREILHKWITRMIMFGLYRTQKVPFQQVYLWGLVTDEHGSKMSKSKGNVIDPLAMTTKYGTDAVRLAGAISNTAGNDSPLGESKFAAHRNFNNKLWNVARFVLSNSQIDQKSEFAEPQPQSLADEWMLNQLHGGINTVTNKIEGYRLNEAANAVYHLLWDDYADWYVETSKIKLSPDVLAYGLTTILKLTHPFVPYVTEAIWQMLPGRRGNLITANWPTAGKTYLASAQKFSELQKIIGEARRLQTELGLGKAPLYYTKSQLLDDNAELVTGLARLSEVSQVKVGAGLPLVATSEDCWLGVDRETIRHYQAKLTSKQQADQKRLASLTQQLSNHGFVKTAPPDVIEATRARQQAVKQRLSLLDQQLKRISQLKD